jgi:hypothetical protein
MIEVVTLVRDIPGLDGSFLVLIALFYTYLSQGIQDLMRQHGQDPVKFADIKVS